MNNLSIYVKIVSFLQFYKFMKTSVVNLESLERELVVSVPIAEFNTKLDKVLSDLRGKVKIDGFRQGRVPPQIIKQKYGANAKSDAANDIVAEVLPQAFETEKLYPAGQPELTKLDFDNADEFSFTVKFEVYPEVKLGDLSKLTVEQITSKISKEDEEKTLTGLKEQAATTKVVKRAAKMDDKVKINFEGFVDGEAFDGGKAEDFSLTLGKNTMIPGFEEALVGKNPGEEFEFNINFPDDYQAENLKGKEATFKITINEVEEVIFPEVDDEFAKKFGKDSVEDLLSGITEQMQIQLDEKLEFANKNNAFDALLAANKIDVPKSSVKVEAQNLLKDMQERMKSQGLPENNNNLNTEIFNEEATKRVKLGLLVNKLTTDNNISATDDEVEEKLKQMAAGYGENAQQMIDYYKNNKDALEGVKSMVVEQKAAQFIIDNAITSTTEKSFTEVVGRG
jgi:trigger factor